MSNSGAIRAGRAYVEIYGDDSPLQKTLNKVSKTLKDFGAKVRGIGLKVQAAGAAIVGALGAAGVAFAEAGSALNDMSLRTGISVESLSSLGYAAQLSGVDMEGLERSIRKMQAYLTGAEDGSAEAAAALEELGLSVESLEKLQPDDQFRMIAGALSKISDPTKKAAMALKVFGKSGTSILPMLEDGTAGLAEMEQRARDLGLVWKTEDAQAADKLGDTLDELWMVIKKLTADIGAAVAPAMTMLARVATGVTAQVASLVRENQWLVTASAAVGIAIIGAGGIILGLGAALTVASVAATVFSTALSVLATLLTPATLIVAALVGGTYAFLRYTETGRQMVSTLSDEFSRLAADAKKTFGGIADALLGGDLKLAGRIALLGLKLELMRGLHGYNNFLEDEKRNWINLFLDMAEKLAPPFVAAFNKLQAVLSQFQLVALNSWTVFKTDFLGITMRMVQASANVFLNLASAIEKMFNIASAAAQKAIADAAENTAPLLSKIMPGFDPYRIRKQADEDLARREAERQARAADRRKSVNDWFRGQADQNQAQSDEEQRQRTAAYGAAAGKNKLDITPLTALFARLRVLNNQDGGEAAKRQKVLDEIEAEYNAALEEARKLRDNPTSEQARANGFNPEQVGSAKAGAITGVDITSKEGAKVITDALAGSHDPAKRTAAATEKLVAIQNRAFVDTHDTAKALAGVGMVGE